MIPQRLRPIFAIERRPLLKGHAVLAFALIPVPWFRTGVADLLVIGDKETVDAALDASETGHLVLSTMHTVNAAQTIPARSRSPHRAPPRS